MSAKSIKLTKRVIDAFSFEGKHDKARDIRWDADLPGFGLRVYPSGKKAFVISYRNSEGRQCFMTLGSYGTLTLDAAEKLARKHLAAIQADGADPLAEKRKGSQGETIGTLVNLFLSQHAEAKLRPRTIGEYRRQLETHVLPRWKTRLVKSIKRADVAALHSKIGEKAPTQANRTIAAMSKMFNFAKVKGFLPDDAANPAQGVERFKEKKRDRWVRPAELPKLIEAVSAEPNTYARIAIWMFLLTGARRTELLKAKWEDVDFDRRELRFPEDNTKAGRVHYVPLSEAALSILANTPRIEGNPYIFVGKLTGSHLVNIDKPWRRIRKAAGVADVRIHDLRRTVGSWLATSGASLPLIGKVLNHADVATTQIYARLAEDPARGAMEEHGKQIMKAAKRICAVK